MNTISTTTFSDKEKSNVMQEFLKSMLVAQKIAERDTSDNKVIQNPYTSEPAVTVNSPMTGSYTPADFTTTDDDLVVDQEIIISEHIRDFEAILTDFNLMVERLRDTTFKVKEEIDKLVLSELATNAGVTGVTVGAAAITAAEVIPTLSALSGEFAGYGDAMNGMYIVIDNTSVAGFETAMATNGFSVADATLRNGFLGSYMGFEIHVVRNGNLPVGTAAVAGIKNVATFAIAGDLRFEEKMVTGKTGIEFVVMAYFGAKLWEQKKPLTANVSHA